MRPSYNTCQICKEPLVSDSHLKTHKISQESYYRTYFPKVDLLTLEPLHFKSKDYYVSHDFNNKVNLTIWLKQQPLDLAREYCEKLLKRRIKKKNLIYTPSQVELKSIMSPAIQYYNELFGDYYQLCGSLGLKNRYLPAKKLEYTDFSAKTKMVIDTREGKPLEFKNFKTVNEKLDFGDYCFDDPSLAGKVYIERKSLVDFIGTLSIRQYDRFCREIERAKTVNSYLVVLIEEPIKYALDFTNLPTISKKIRISPEFIFNNVRSLCQKYDNIQFLFVDGRKEAAKVSVDILSSNGSCKNYDLQLCYDSGLIPK